MSDKALAEKASTDLVENDVANAALAGLGEEDLVLPVLKLTQALSAEVANDEAKQGEFVNSLTGANHGAEVELIVSGYFKGRFYAPKDEEQVYVAQGDVAPSNWPEKYAGRRFDEIEDAEEQTRERANAPGGSWEPPLIQTTHNYVGLIPGDLELPVRLSLKSSSAAAHRKIATLLRFSPGGRPWSNVIALKAKRKSSGDYTFFVVEAARGRATDEDEQQAAVGLAQSYQSQNTNVQLTGEADERKGDRKAADSGDGLDVV